MSQAVQNSRSALRSTERGWRRLSGAFFTLAGLAIALGSPGMLAKKAPAAEADVAETDNLPRQLRRLGDDRFAIRREARRQLRAQLDDPQTSVELTSRLVAALAGSEISGEARFEIAALLPAEAQPALESAPAPSDAEIVALIEDLRADRYDVRAAARDRLLSLVRGDRSACRLLAPLTAKLADATIDRDYRETIEAIRLRRANVWLVDESLDDALPQVADEQIDRWLADLIAPDVRGADAAARQQVAELQLTDLLCREAYRERIAARLQAAAAAQTDEEAQARIQQVLDWTLPAMAAEIWIDRAPDAVPYLDAVQYLLINLPQPHPGARITLFDRIDDRVAHCVSGNALHEGDWPVGVAIHAVSNSSGSEFMIALVNLPTPRRRQAYEVDLLRPDAPRLAELTERTCRAILADKRHLGGDEIALLGQLDPAVVSRFIGAYFAVAPDRPLPRRAGDIAGLTERDLICMELMQWGLNGAQDALDREALVRGEPAGDRLPLARLASFSIALRDPWPGVDAWLAKLVAKPAEFQPLAGRRSDLSAIAAVILLERHHQAIDEFSLELPPANEERVPFPIPGVREDDPFQELPRVNEAGFPLLYRFADPSGRAAVLRWWAALDKAQADHDRTEPDIAVRR